MSDSADEGGFHPHPGDPWHPEWTEEAAAGEIGEAAGAEETEPKKKRRGLFRRKPKGDTGEELAGEETAAEPADPGDDREDIPAPASTGEDLPPEAAMPDAPGTGGTKEEFAEAPLPAWLADLTYAAGENAAVAVESPTWVGAATAGADDIAGGFVEPPAEPTESAPPEVAAFESPDPNDVAAALQAIGALVEEGEVVPIDPMEDQKALFGFEEPLSGDTPQDLPPEVAAAASEYGVAGKEAFEALREIHDEDLGDWRAFAEAGELPLDVPPVPITPALPPEELPDPDAFDGWVEEAPTRKRGIWPFRRRRVPEEGAEMAEEAADWVGEGSSVPADWFAEVDEDLVVPPPEHLPETEWPEPEPVPPPAVEPGGWEVPVAAANLPAPAEPVDEPVSPGSIPVRFPEEPAAEAIEDFAPLEFDHGYGFDELAAPEEAPAPPGWGAADEAVADSELPVASPTASDSPSGVEVPAAMPPGDDEWVIDPIDLDEGYDDATVELPAGYASADDITQQIYTTSATMGHRGFAEELSRAGDEDTEWQAISAAMPGVGSGVVGFDDVADLGDDEDVYEAPTRSQLGTRVFTGVVLVGLLTAAVWVGGAAAAAFIGLLTLLGLGEFYSTLRHRGYRPLALFGYLGGIAMMATTWFHGPVAIAVSIGLTATVVFFVYAFAPLRRDALTNGGLTVLGVTWVVGTIAFVEPILRAERYRVLVAAIVAVTAAMDIGAYTVGRTWGRRALAPILSPNKSVEGLAGGIAACLGAAAAIGALMEPFDLRSGLALGVVVCVVAPLGDLAESMVKRSLGVKDMGAVLPGHGGILDRIDAFLFVLPAVWVLFETIGLLG